MIGELGDLYFRVELLRSYTGWTSEMVCCFREKLRDDIGEYYLNKMMKEMKGKL